MKHQSYPDGITRHHLIEWFREGRQRSKSIFDLVKPDHYYSRPIALRNPIVFYEGHLPAFTVNTLQKLALGRPGIDEALELLFARGIDPDSPEAVQDPASAWPSRRKVQDYAERADSLIEETLTTSVIEDPMVPALRHGEAAIGILEHEQMHQETLLYMLHNMPLDQKVSRLPFAAEPAQAGKPVVIDRDSTPEIVVPAGPAFVGMERDGAFGWDNEFPRQALEVRAFAIDRDNVTNGQYLAYMTETSAPAPHFWTGRDGQWFWRGMFELLPLPLDWPVYVTHEEATAYAKWLGKRLPTEAEYDRAAYGSPSGVERRYPWGDRPPDSTRGNFGFRNWNPVPAGSYPDGASAWGVRDLVGNGWEWTSTVFDKFPGFEPMASYPVYSADFFDGEHFVLKGASPATATHLIRRSFRNWFRPNYPYVYATFRCARDM